MKNDKKILGVSTIAIIALILILLGATYAFFKVTDASDTDFPLEVTTNTTDSLIFNVSSDITFTASPTNFNKGMGNQEKISTATATLKANNKTGNASEHYYLYLDITKNYFTYTTEDEKPEILLQVINPNNEEIKNIKGLEYKIVTDGNGEILSGFDITTAFDIIPLSGEYEINTTNTKTDNWQIKVTLVNLESDQLENGGRDFAGKIVIKKEDDFKLSKTCINQNLAECIKNNYDLDSNIIYHKNLANSAEDDSYRYSGAYETVENYVCFGYNGTNNCPEDNLYRIIGVFGDNVKLIKANYAKSSELGDSGAFIIAHQNIHKGIKKYANEIAEYRWKSDISIAGWEDSDLNTINLNTNFLNTFDTIWQGKIASTNWITSTSTEELLYKFNAKETYKNEILLATENDLHQAKIGLVYVSDYMYAATQEHWTKIGHETSTNSEYDYISARGSNWMFSGLNEWTITYLNEKIKGAYIISGDGNTGIKKYDMYNVYIRPCFYLNQDVILTGGTGTYLDPFTIN